MERTDHPTPARTGDTRASTLGEGFPRAVALLGGAGFVAFGAWAMIAPRAFFDAVALFEPYNRHFLQDIGAFQVGLGAVLLLAAAVPRADALAVALLGVGAGATLHVLSHLLGTDLGGNSEADIPTFALIAVLLLAAGVTRWRYAGGPAR